jgi:large subunit ribosomal protein L10e
VSKKWGFTNVNKQDYVEKEKKVSVYILLTTVQYAGTDFAFYRDGAYVQFIRPKGPFERSLRNQLKA